MLRKIRTVLALVLFVGVTLLFLDFTGTMGRLVGWMAKIQFLPALLAVNIIVIIALILLTLVLGRIYCSIICPLGVFQDVVARIGRRGKKKPYSYSKEMKWLRYPVLVIFILAFVMGIGSLVALLAPYSSWGRIATNLLQPIYAFIYNLLASVESRFDSYYFHDTDIWIRSLPTFIIAAVTFVVIVVLAWRNGRTYCNTICPVGTILSFFSRFSLFRIIFDTEKCKKCSKCSTHCKAACIDFKNQTVDYSRCVVCGDCLGYCDFDALHYTLALGKKKDVSENKSANVHDSDNETIDKGRRAFVLGTASAVSASALAQAHKKVDGGLAELAEKKAPERTTPITPPGSISANNMAKHCTGCQLCVAECPNQVLRPSTGLFTMMQPTMSYEHGFCRPECTRCSQVCPAGAINPINKAEKSSIQIGHAVWVKDNCLPVTEGVHCGNCARHCPTGAIKMMPYNVGDKKVMVPTVNTAVCIGCGACEYVCPSRPYPAIYVEGHEMHRTI